MHRDMLPIPVGRAMRRILTPEGVEIARSRWFYNVFTDVGRAFLEVQSYASTYPKLTGMAVGNGTGGQQTAIDLLSAPTSSTSGNTAFHAFDVTPTQGTGSVSALKTTTYQSTFGVSEANFSHSVLMLVNVANASPSTNPTFDATHIPLTSLAVGAYNKTLAQNVQLQYVYQTIAP